MMERGRVCVAIKRRLERQKYSPAVRFIPYQSDEAARLLGTEYVPSRPSMAYFMDSMGNVSRGMSAFIPFLSWASWWRILSSPLAYSLV